MLLIEASSPRPRLIFSLFLPLYFKSQMSVVLGRCTSRRHWECMSSSCVLWRPCRQRPKSWTKSDRLKQMQSTDGELTSRFAYFIPHWLLMKTMSEFVWIDAEKFRLGLKFDPLEAIGGDVLAVCDVALIVWLTGLWPRDSVEADAYVEFPGPLSCFRCSIVEFQLHSYGNGTLYQPLLAYVGVRKLLTLDGQCLHH